MQKCFEMLNYAEIVELLLIITELLFKGISRIFLFRYTWKWYYFRTFSASQLRDFFEISYVRKLIQ